MYNIIPILNVRAVFIIKLFCKKKIHNSRNIDGSTRIIGDNEVTLRISAETEARDYRFIEDAANQRDS